MRTEAELAEMRAYQEEEEIIAKFFKQKANINPGTENPPSLGVPIVCIIPSQPVGLIFACNNL